MTNVPHTRRVPAILLLAALLLAACTPAPSPPVALQPTVQPSPVAAVQTPASPQRTAQPTPTPQLPTPSLPTATLPPTPVSQSGIYDNPALGVTFNYPPTWAMRPGQDASTLAWLTATASDVFTVVFYTPLTPNVSLQQAARDTRASTASGVKNVQQHGERKIALADGREAWTGEYTANQQDGTPLDVIVTSTARGGQLFSLMTYGTPDGVARERQQVDDIVGSLLLHAPQIYGVPRDQAIVLAGGESNNVRGYDPAFGGGDDMLWSGLVMFSPQLQVLPDLAERWDVSEDKTSYTFHLRPQARFHDGKPVTARDVIYSWERAAAPETDSNSVLTYLGDIVGVTERRAGKADHIAGLRAVDDHTLEVRLAGPRPTFLMKLAFRVTSVVDQANVESGPEWYRTPNGTGPYRLIRWERDKARVYERFEGFYADPPPTRFVVVLLNAGEGVRLYETGQIDFAGVGSYNLQRMHDPAEPLHRELVEGVSMCTSYISFDVTRPPFDDVHVREAFSLAVDRKRYVDVALLGAGIPAHGLYPPALPGYRADLQGQTFDPLVAQQRLAESKYGSAAKLPPIVFTTSGLGSDVGKDVAALAQMWQTTLGVTITVENLEPDHADEALHAGRHGQLISYGWCADYPDPENFADALFHSGAEANLGHYANPQLDALLDEARSLTDPVERIQRYQQAEQLIVADTPAIFLSHGLVNMLVKPYIKGYVYTPVAVPFMRYLSLDAGGMG